MNGAIAAQKAIWPKVEKPYASANVAYPTDSGLLAKGVVALVGLVAVIKLAGLPAAPVSGIVTGRCAAVLTRSRCGCGGVTTTPKRRSWPSPASSPPWPRSQ